MRKATACSASFLGFSRGNGVVTDEGTINMIGLARKVIEVNGNNELESRFIPMEDSDRIHEREVYNRIPSIEKAKKKLNYNPEISLDEGIRRVIEYKKSLNEK